MCIILSLKCSHVTRRIEIVHSWHTIREKRRRDCFPVCFVYVYVANDVYRSTGECEQPVDNFFSFHVFANVSDESGSTRQVKAPSPPSPPTARPWVPSEFLMESNVIEFAEEIIRTRIATGESATVRRNRTTELYLNLPDGFAHGWPPSGRRHRRSTCSVLLDGAEHRFFFFFFCFGRSLLVLTKNQRPTGYGYWITRLSN